MFSRSESSPMTPCSLRSSGQKPMPRRMASTGEAICASAPSMRMVPSSARSMPKSRRAVSVRPDPRSPPMPRDSPPLTSRSTPRTDPRRPRPLALRNGVAVGPPFPEPLPPAAGAPDPASLVRTGARSWTSRPTMRVISPMRERSDTGYSPTSRPFRSTVMRSEISNVWSMKCVMKRIAIPCAFSRRTTENSIRTSSSARLEVGSSRIRILARAESDRAMAHICCTAIEYEESGAITSTRTFRSARSASALRRMRPQRIPNVSAPSRPRQMFSATDRFGQRFTSWYTVLMPSFWASSGLDGLISFPSRRMRPESAGWTPVRTLIRVDFPAPFCPMTEWTSPANRRKSTSASAWTPGKRFEMPFISSTGTAWLITSPRRRRSGHAGPLLLPAAHEAGPSVLPARERLRSVLLREDALLGDDALGEGLSGLQFLDRLHQLRPEQRAALDAGVQLSGHHGFERALHRVDRHDHDVLAGLEAGFLDRLDGADGHVIVVRVEDVDLVAFRLEERLHDLLALGAREVAGLGAGDLVVRVVLEDLLEPGLAIDGRGGAHRPLQLDDVHVALGGELLDRRVRDEPLRGAAPLLDEVGAHERDPERVILHVYVPVGEDDGDPGRLRLAEHRLPARLDHRRESDDVHLLGDEGADGLDLVLLLLLRVGELEGDVRLDGGVLDGLGVRGPPFALGADLRKSEDDLLVRPRQPGVRDGDPEKDRGHDAERSLHIVSPDSGNAWWRKPASRTPGRP